MQRAEKVTLRTADLLDKRRYIKLILKPIEEKKPYVKNFKVWTGTKYRNIAEPIQTLKKVLKEENKRLLLIYERKLKEYNIEEIPQAYRKNKNVKTNAKIHKGNKYWYKFDFSKFYDSISLKSLEKILENIYEDFNDEKEKYYDYFFNPKTKGLTQGSPTSGTLAGLLLIPFWIKLKNNLKDVKITQYSDDLCISSNKKLDIKFLENLIKDILKKENIPCKINKKKTKILTNQARKLTGVACNKDNEITLKRKDYRRYRAMFNALNKSKNKEKTLSNLGFTIDEFLGRLNFYLYIDTTNKIRKLTRRNKEVLKVLKYINSK